MKSLIIFILLIISSNLFSNMALKNNYLVKSNYVMLSDIVNNPKKDVLLYTFDINQHTKRVKTKNLIKKLKHFTSQKYSLNHSYIQFSQTSPIDTSRIKNRLKNWYLKSYKNIVIKSISVEPRAYLTSIPNNYEIITPRNYYLSNVGILYVKTVDKKKIFFNYRIEAKVEVFVSRDKIHKGDEISNLNIKKNSIMLDKFRAMPIQEIKKETIQAKHNININKIITKRDVVGLYLIKRGSDVSVISNSFGIDISIFAKAQQNGQYGQSIYVKTQNGKKIKVIVTGRNQAEVK